MFVLKRLSAYLFSTYTNYYQEQCIKLNHVGIIFGPIYMNYKIITDLHINNTRYNQFSISYSKYSSVIHVDIKFYTSEKIDDKYVLRFDEYTGQIKSIGFNGVDYNTDMFNGININIFDRKYIIDKIDTIDKVDRFQLISYRVRF